MRKYRLNRIKKHRQTWQDARITSLIKQVLQHEDSRLRVLAIAEQKGYSLQTLGIKAIDDILAECLRALDKMEHDLLATMTSNDAFMAVK